MVQDSPYSANNSLNKNNVAAPGAATLFLYMDLFHQAFRRRIDFPGKETARFHNAVIITFVQKCRTLTLRRPVIINKILIDHLVPEGTVHQNVLEDSILIHGYSADFPLHTAEHTSLQHQEAGNTDTPYSQNKPYV